MRHSHSDGYEAAVDRTLSHQHSRWSTPVREGVYLCEPALWVHWVQKGDLDASGQVSLLTLEVRAFEELVSSSVNMSSALQSHAADVQRALNCTKRLTDLFSTTDVLASMGSCRFLP